MRWVRFPELRAEVRSSGGWHAMFKDEMRPSAVEIVHLADSILVSFSGEWDIASAADMRQSLLRSDVATASTVQVDLTEVTFLDTTGVGVLVSACKRVRGKGGTFFVTCERGIARSVLAVLGLLDYFQVAEP